MGKRQVNNNVLYLKNMFISSFTDKSGERHEVGKITLLIGPNNTGKTLTLNEIVNCATNFDFKNPKIVSSVDIHKSVNFDELLETLIIKETQNPDEYLFTTLGVHLENLESRRLKKKDIEHLYNRDIFNRHPMQLFNKLFIKYGFIYLTTVQKNVTISLENQTGRLDGAPWPA